MPFYKGRTMDRRDEITFESDPVWTDQYEEERERIMNALGEQLLGVFHVGSTAIPDLPGKPALDVIAVFTDYESMHAAAETLTDEGYELGHDGSDCIVVIDWGDDRAVFIKLHTRDNEAVRNQLIFRDYLRETPEARQEYERCKREAVAAHPDDMEAYTRAKTDMVKSLLKRAREDGYAERLPEFA